MKARYFYMTFLGRTVLDKIHVSSKIVAFSTGVIDIMKAAREVQAEYRYPTIPIIYYSIELSKEEYLLAMEGSKGRV